MHTDKNVQHFLNLDKCDCGAYRYLAIREHKRSYEVYLIHHLHSQNSQNQRKYAKLASIPKHKLNIHEIRINQLANTKTISVSYEQALALRSLLKDIDSEGTPAESGLIPVDSKVETILA